MGHTNINTTLVYGDWDMKVAQAGVLALDVKRKGKGRRRCV
jgi:hypothetical protein